MIQKVKINAISYTTGVNKHGEGYDMVILDTDGGKLSMYCDKVKGSKNLERTREWKSGDEVELNVEQNGQYLNFSLPSKSEARFEEIEKRLGLIEEAIKNAQEKKKKVA